MKSAPALPLLLALAACQPKPLTVCADPNNLPFSNKAGQGFENKLAEVIAADLHRPLRYVWWAQRRGYVRNTLTNRACDLWPGVATGLERLRTTRPWYSSSYVFVTRAKADLAGLTLDDPRLRHLRLGVQLVGDDGENTPPAHALASRGITENVTGFMLYGDYRLPNPPARIVNAVEDGSIDVGLVWGPLAGYFARNAPVPLRLEPITPVNDGGLWPMRWQIAVGVRKDDAALQSRVDAILRRRRPEIAALLREYAVPPGQPAPLTN